ncbi:MarR family winged helix-turn-helix transcriptional regulator [Arthrobacter sp. G119Y2]|uniref:MarR family winged helix-turn-helix transcriptional regulator n=1 Tax=Arthrobacter sp. G119Y2 TaxID=3134965 RepID=UPI0031194DC7
MSVNQQTAEELITQVYRLQRQLRCVAQRSTDPRGPGTALLAVLRLIGEQPEIRATELAGKLGIGAAGLSRHLSELVEMGYVCRRPHPEDGRAYLISLTPAGSRAVTEDMHRRSELLQHMLDDWTNEEAALASDSLAKLADTLHTSIRDTSIRAMKPGTHPTPTPAGEN